MENNFIDNTNPRYLATLILKGITFEEKILDDFFFGKNFPILNQKDKDLCYFIVVGTLKKFLLIDFILKKFSKIELNKVDPFILSLLRISTFQLFFSNKLPSYAILNEAVKIAKFKFPRKKYISGYVNGLLRTISKIGDHLKFIENENLNEMTKNSLMLNIPPFLLKKLLSSYELKKIKNYFHHAQNPSKYYAVLNEKKISLNKFLKLLKDKGLEFEITPEEILIFNKIGELENFVEKGFIFLQDISISKFFFKLKEQIKNIDEILDLCGAPGGKSFSLKLHLNPKKILSLDKSFKRLLNMKKRIKNLSFNNICLICGDCTNLSMFKKNFDLVYVDAPCSSTGTYVKNPEVFLRINERKIKSMTTIQKNILDKAFKKVKKGGYLVYSTCSILKDENEMVVENFLERHSNFESINFSLENKYYKTFPHFLDGIGFFSAIFIRKE